MRAREFITELKLPKNSWVVLLTSDAKEEAGTELIDLVQRAYSATSQGSFVNSIRDVIPSDWSVIDFDDDPDIDGCVFYRYPRSGELWQGQKIQGIGHDGTTLSKQKTIQKTVELLSKPGYWIESSDAMRAVLKKLNVPAVTNVDILKKLFRDPTLKMISDDTYIRILPTGRTITETVFGNPVVIDGKEI
jgi:hypothetical protein